MATALRSLARTTKAQLSTSRARLSAGGCSSDMRTVSQCSSLDDALRPLAGEPSDSDAVLKDMDGLLRGSHVVVRNFDLGSFE